ncbi:MAG: YlxR family protein [Microlunatus sp.]|nr:YlxR family protein [Microlunatus sp.]
MEPVRTCLGCRGRENKADLIRLVWGDGAIVVDVRQTAPGRGGYLHRTPQCWDRALQRRSLSRALGVADVDRESLLSRLRAAAGNGGAA